MQDSANPKQDISTNRGTFELKNQRYTQNVKLMARLKNQTKIKGDFALQNMNEKSSSKKLNPAVISQQQSLMDNLINKLNRENSRQPQKDHITTVVLTNKTFDNSFAKKNPSQKIQVRSCGASTNNLNIGQINTLQSNNSFQKRSFIEEINVPVTTQLLFTQKDKESLKNLLDQPGAQCYTSLGEHRQIKKCYGNIKKREELNDYVKSRMFAHMADK